MLARGLAQPTRRLANQPWLRPSPASKTARQPQTDNWVGVPLCPSLKRQPGPGGCDDVSLRVLFTGAHPGCLEMYRGLDKVDHFTNGKRDCHWDGKHSLVRFQGRYLIYSRSNLSPHGGQRFVQVTRSTTSDAAGPYEPFQLIRIQDYNPKPGNLYFAAIDVNPVDPSTLLGLFPVNRNATSNFIGLALSCDGVHWSMLTELVDTAGQSEGRTHDQPVGGFVTHGGDIYFLVHMDVQGIMLGTKVPRGRLAFYQLARDALAAYTRETASKTAGCSQGH